MSSYIHHSLMLLEDAGLAVNYPVFRKVIFDEQGVGNMPMSFSCRVGRRVSIENNIKLKLMVIFSIFDFYIDEKHPPISGESFAYKYKNLPSENDNELILKELFRLWKLIRNALTHQSSALSFEDENLNVLYEFKGRTFQLKMLVHSLDALITLTLMYSKGLICNDLYSGGIVRSIYSNIISGIEILSDEFSSEIVNIDNPLKMNPYIREVFVNYEYSFDVGCFYFKKPEVITKGIAIDFCFERDGKIYIVPVEALDSSFSITEEELKKYWEYTGKLPNIKI